MPTDLQAALDRWDSERSEHVIRRQRGSDDVELFVDAARLVADPNHERALAILYAHDQPKTPEQVTRLKQVSRWIVDAALTPGDTK